MKHGSLFSGIGGFDLAAEWMGWENVFHCEWNPFGQKVLKHYWPNAISYNDITKTDFTIHRGAIDILTGGFPCQPYSAAGKRLGKEDERHLWPSMLRAIREIQPRWIVGENVLGLVNWNGGMVFEEVQADLEAEGYQVQPYVLPAAAVNAPHRRDRVWFVAYATSARAGQNFGGLRSVFDRCNTREENATSFTNTDSNSRRATEGNINEEGQHIQRGTSRFGIQRTSSNTKSKQSERVRFEQREFSQQEQREFRGGSSEMVDSRYVSNAEQQRFQRCSDTGEISNEKRTMGREGNKLTTWITSVNKQSNWDNFPTVSPICVRNDGLSNRLDGITFSKWRNESIKAGGNAIVPQVVYQIFKAIEQYGIQNPSQHKGTF